MKLFKSIGTILEATTKTFVTTAEAINTTAQAADNVAKMAEEATSSMLEEQRTESKASLEALQASLSAPTK